MILLNIVPLLAVEILYGLNVYRPHPYYLCAAIAAALGITTLLRFHASSIYSVLQLLNAASIAYFAHTRDFRVAAYWSLGIVFVSAAINSWRRLHKGSIGRIAFVLALTLWAISFYIHPWTIQHALYEPVAVHIWEMQKFFAIIGILIVLLESEIRENHRLAMHDQLTGLPNRGFLENTLLQAMSRGPCAVILLDLNDFKKFNDTLGHLAGDEILRQFSLNVRGLLSQHDTLARVGGDEFIIVTRNFTLTDTVRAALPIHIHIGSESYKVSSGIGASMHPEDSGGATGYAALKQLILAADTRMYENKTAAKS
jgi:diguanylate cyclase (GGDEF)-like protein